MPRTACSDAARCGPGHGCRAATPTSSTRSPGTSEGRMRRTPTRRRAHTGAPRGVHRRAPQDHAARRAEAVADGATQHAGCRRPACGAADWLARIAGAARTLYVPPRNPGVEVPVHRPGKLALGRGRAVPRRRRVELAPGREALRLPLLAGGPGRGKPSVLDEAGRGPHRGKRPGGLSQHRPQPGAGPLSVPRGGRAFGGRDAVGMREGLRAAGRGAGLPGPRSIRATSAAPSERCESWSAPCMNPRS